MFSLLSLEEDGKKDEQVKKRRTEVLAVGIAEDDAGANAEDERGEAEEICSEQARQEGKKEKKKKKKKKKKEMEMEMLGLRLRPLYFSPPHQYFPHFPYFPAFPASPCAVGAY